MKKIWIQKLKMVKIKPRVIETDEGIQGDFNLTIYDKMQRHLRDKGWIETNRIIAFGNAIVSKGMIGIEIEGIK